VAGEDDDSGDPDPEQAILKSVYELSTGERGDILIFLSGEREIRDTAAALRKHRSPETEVLPLYARLSAAEQDRVFVPHHRQRIVLATNVAETSLTVPGIRYVIDPGYARVSRYSHRVKVQRLPVEKISQASANQRKGRCGRVGPGICIRLYSEQDYISRPEFTEPEIRRTNLAAVILQMKALDLGDLDQFPFIDPPDSPMVNDGFRVLAELSAVDERRELTAIGRKLARLPVDPRIGRMLLAANAEGCVSEVLVIASALSVPDPRERFLQDQQAASEKHSRFNDERSDFLAFVNLWKFFEEQREILSQNQLRKFCQENFLSFMRMREWRDLHRQLLTLARELGFRLNGPPAEYDAIHRALLTGLLGNVAFKGEGNEYTGARNVELFLFPGSGLFNKGPKWIMAAEFIETSRRYAHTVAKIEPEWIERLAGHLLRRSYYEPHWEKNAAQVAAYERASLYGLVINPRRKVHYGSIEPEESRRIFIQRALVDGDYRTDAPFFLHNRALIGDIQEIEEKSRRRDVLVDEHELFSFYDSLIPADINNGAGFERWRKKAERDRPGLLFLTREALMRHGAEDVTEDQFPSFFNVGGTRFPLEYHFEPGHPADGVTVTVPLAALNQIDPVRCEWLVPGLLPEKVTAVLKSLPKSLRRSFVPVPDYVDACLEAIVPGAEPLASALAVHLHQLTGVRIPHDAWRLEGIPAHLLMNFKIVDEGGRELAMGRDLSALQRELGREAGKSFGRGLAGEFLREGIVRWDFGDVADEVAFELDGLSLTGYPALEDHGQSVTLKLFDSPDQADWAMRGGVLRLFMMELAQPLNYVQKNLPGIERMCSYYSSVGSREELKEDLIRAITNRAFIGDEPPVRRAKEFAESKEKAGKGLMTVANEICALAEAVLEEYRAVTRGIQGSASPMRREALADVRDQLARLVYKGFISATPLHWLRHFPRYLKAIRLRLKRLDHDSARDARRAAEIASLWRPYLERAESHRERGIRDPELERYRWMLEEQRVSLFAQELKTAFPVSIKRLREQWERVKP
jgi:ATP-dependent helicase HrpA